MKIKTKENKLTHKVSILVVIILLICSILVVIPNFIKSIYNEVPISETIFCLLSSTDKTNTNIFLLGIKFCLLPCLLLTSVFIFPLTNIFKKDIYINTKNKNIKLYPYTSILNHRKIYLILLFLICLLYSSINLNIFSYFKSQMSYSNIFEDNYVEAVDTKITFPDKKRNLIIIRMESMENIFISNENGGSPKFKKSRISELENLALDQNNINFSNTDKIGGAISVPGTTFTTAGTISQSSGTPLLINLPFKSYKNNNIVPGVVSLGDILKDAGYNLEAMYGCSSTFGEIKPYLTAHGNYKVFDLYTAKDKDLVDENYFIWWGIEDKKLYEYAKNEITELAKEEKPFSLSLTTIDTHFVDGHLDESCPTPFEDHYENVYNCASLMVNDFINWIKKQDFYENTTIVVLGDHLNFQKSINDLAINNYERTLYNVFINSIATTDNNKNRLFTSMDFFPTILASIGVKIDGNRLGLGTNLFSEEQTIIEEYGKEYVTEELKKQSKYYKEKIENR